MKTRRSAVSPALGLQYAERAFASAQVIAARTQRMLLVSGAMSAQDKAEFRQMWQEKPAAFANAGFAMAMESWRLQQKWLFDWWTAWSKAVPLGIGFATLNSANNRILQKGLEPIERTARANARRLAGQRNAGQRNAGQRNAGQRNAGQRNAGQRNASKRGPRTR